MKKPLPPRSLLLDLLDYSVITGRLYWRANIAFAVKAGDPAGCATGRGYRIVKINQGIYKAHRIAWCMVTGQDPGQLDIDHINGDPSDNAWHNLRLVTLAENAHNQRLGIRNTSGYKGVARAENKWEARIMSQGKRHFLGLFDTPEQAGQAYLKAKRELHPSAPAHHFERSAA